MKAATFSGTDQEKFQDRREFSGSLFQQMEEMYAYLDLRNHTKATFEILYLTDIRDYPEEALCEALINSIVHGIIPTVQVHWSACMLTALNLSQSANFCPV